MAVILVTKSKMKVKLIMNKFINTHKLIKELTIYIMKGIHLNIKQNMESFQVLLLSL